MSLLLAAEDIVKGVTEIQVQKNIVIMGIFVGSDFLTEHKELISKHFDILDDSILKSRKSTTNPSDHKVAIYTLLENTLESLKNTLITIDLVLENIDKDKNIPNEYNEKIKALTEKIKEEINKVIEKFFI